MPRTAPAVNGTPTLKSVSIRMIDASGDVRTDSYDFDASVTPAQIETFVTALAAVTQASIYEVRVADAYSSVPDTNDAEIDARNSLFSNMVFLAKNAIKDAVNFYVPAPQPELFIPTTDEIAIDTDLIALFSAFLALQNAGTLRPDMDIVSGRYTERKEVNKVIKI